MQGLKRRNKRNRRQFMNNEVEDTPTLRSSKRLKVLAASKRNYNSNTEQRDLGQKMQDACQSSGDACQTKQEDVRAGTLYRSKRRGKRIGRESVSIPLRIASDMYSETETSEDAEAGEQIHDTLEAQRLAIELTKLDNDN